jgi:hypothetical protein
LDRIDRAGKQKPLTQYSWAFYAERPLNQDVQALQSLVVSNYPEEYEILWGRATVGSRKCTDTLLLRHQRYKRRTLTSRCEFTARNHYYGPQALQIRTRCAAT